MKRVLFLLAFLAILLLVVSCVKPEPPKPPAVFYSANTIVKSGKGSIAPDKLSGITPGSNLDLRFIPESGYSLYSVKINGVLVDDIIPSPAEVTYTIRDIKSNITVEVVFVKTDILLLSKLEPALKLARVLVHKVEGDQYLRSVALTQEEKARKLYHYYPSMDVKVISSDGSLYWSEKWDLVEDTYKQGGQILKKIKLTDIEFSYQGASVWSNADNCYIYYIHVYERN